MTDLPYSSEKGMTTVQSFNYVQDVLAEQH